MAVWFASNREMETVNLAECMLGNEHLTHMAKSFKTGNKFQKIILAGNLMLEESLICFAEALRDQKLKATYLDFGNSPKLMDEAMVNFYQVLHRGNKIVLETLILRGNSNLKQNAGLALEKLTNE
jgi:hypothetical protein